jgi:diaminohydroxyphosphoribosylaminopyrimidine deaminase/5-amino-6-(5-phosphoribosylamino)uracil reductase
MNDYEKLMKKCIKLALKGQGKTSPNPMVGSIVLDKNNNIISTGYHHKYGQNHAERDALLKLKNGEEKDGTLIVNLEPCSHFGKTPPCADLIVERGIKKVVIGTFDSNPKVGGKGIKKLKDNGIEVITGVLEESCRKLNEIFFTDIEQKRCFVALKTATTIDGKISTSTGNSKWITSDKSREYARGLRGVYDAILTSSSTILSDNPTMKHNIKIILDRTLRTSFDMEIFKQGRIILVTDKSNQVETMPENVEILRVNSIDEKLDIKEVLRLVYEMGIKSVFIEAGGKLCGEFISKGLADKIYHFVAPKVLNDNTGKSCFDGDKITKISESKTFNLSEIKKLGSDYVAVYDKT